MISNLPNVKIRALWLSIFSISENISLSLASIVDDLDIFTACVILCLCLSTVCAFGIDNTLSNVSNFFCRQVNLCQSQLHVIKSGVDFAVHFQYHLLHGIQQELC